MPKFRQYSFWLGLISAVVLAAETIAKAFGCEISADALTTTLNAILSVLVVLGIVVKDNSKDKNNNTQGSNKHTKFM